MDYNKEELLNEHLEELKKDLANEGIEPNSALGKQILRLTRSTIRQHHEINQLEKRIAELEGQVPARQTIEIPTSINLTERAAETLCQLIEKRLLLGQQKAGIRQF